MMTPITLGRLLSLQARRHSRGAWALGDQAVVSLGNCLTGIMLAGTLSLDDFGAFVLIFGILLFLNSLHSSLVTFPLSVRGAPSDMDALRRLTGYSLLFTVALFLPLSAGLVPIAVVDRVSLIPSAAAAMLLWQLHETLRRGLMAHLRHRDALLGDALRYVGQVAAIWLIARADALTLEVALMTIAAAAVPAVLMQVLQLRPIFSLARSSADLLRDYWSLGRWVLLSNLVAILAIQGVPWTLAYMYGKPAVARFGLLSQVMGVTNLVMIGGAGLIVPAVAGAAIRGLGAATHVALVYTAQGAALFVPYCAAVLLWPELFLGVFSTNNPAYMDLGWQLRLVVVAYLLFFPGQMMQAILNGLGRTRPAFAAQCAFAAATLLLSVPLAAAFGLNGAVWGGVLPPLAFISASMLMLRRELARGAVPVAAMPPGAPLSIAARDGVSG